MTETPDNLNDKIQNWLATEGYPLEFRTAHALRSAGLSVTMGLMLGQDQPREIDVVADSPFGTPSSDYTGRVRLLVECKYARKKPWIVLQSSSQHGGVVDLLATPHSANIDSEMIFRTAKHENTLLDTIHFTPKMVLGHGIVQAFGNSKHEDDLPYRTLMKVSSMAWEHATCLDQSSRVSTFYLVVLPVIIVDTHLVRAVYDPTKDSIQVDEIEAARINWSVGTHRAIVHVVSAKHLDDYAKAAQLSTMKLAQSLSLVIDNT